MDHAIRNVMHEVIRASDEERITFPEVVAALNAAGVARYHVDLLSGDWVFHMPSGDSETVTTHRLQEVPAPQFSAEGVASAIRAIQTEKIRYREFCVCIAQAGCVGYHVFIEGRRALYYGSNGDLHTEWFPGARP